MKKGDLVQMCLLGFMTFVLFSFSAFVLMGIGAQCVLQNQNLSLTNAIPLVYENMTFRAIVAAIMSGLIGSFVVVYLALLAERLKKALEGKI